MRSVTSCFNSTLYRKNLSRFWPLWVSWLVLWLFLTPMEMVSSAGILRTTSNALDAEYATWRLYYKCMRLPSNTGDAMVILGAVFAVVCVMAVFGYLFNHRAAATIHALPMRRETLFATNYLSGLTFLVLPDLVVLGVTVLVELCLLPADMSAQTVPVLVAWFWAKLGTELFFYSFAVFCAQFTGNLLALPAFYGILNVLVVVMWELCISLADAIYFGFDYAGVPALVQYLTPAFALSEATQWNGASWGLIFESDYNYRLLDPAMLGFSSPKTIAAYAALGLVLSAAALLLYRRRRVESAGDVVSIPIVRPIFRTGVAVCAGIAGGILMWAFFNWSSESVMVVSMLLWTVVGYFAAEMLLQKSFKVFKKAWKGCAALVLVCGLVFAGMMMDVLGVQTWVPEGGRVESVVLSIHSTYPYDDASSVAMIVEDPAMIEEIVDLHQAIVDDFNEHGEFWEGDDYMSVGLEYTLQDGSAVNRRYSSLPVLRSGIMTPGETSYSINRIVNDREVVRKAYGLDTIGDGTLVLAEVVRVNAGETTGQTDVVVQEGLQELWAAVQADFEAGNLGRRHLFDDEVRSAETYYSDLELYFLIPDNDGEASAGVIDFGEEVIYGTVMATQEGRSWNRSLTVTLTPYAENTLRVLEQYSGLGEEYELITHAEQDEAYSK